MKTTKKSNNAGGHGQLIAICAMFFLFAMISFVTNLAAPIGTIWGNQFAGNSFLGMLGNMMNFLAYLIMGIPAGMLITKYGYKKTALIAMAVGVLGLFLQWLSGVVGGEQNVAQSTAVVEQNIDGTLYQVQTSYNVTMSFITYLIGAFVGGFCVCMLNTVVNPMLNLLGGGGKKGNQLLQTGGALNSLAGTLTPFLVGALIGQLTPRSTIGNVAPLLWIAMGIFAAAFFVILAVKIPEPRQEDADSKSEKGTSGKKKTALSYRHCMLGVIAIFFYVGCEVSIPGTMNFYLSDQGSNGAGVLGEASVIAGALAAIYWLLMLVGRCFSGIISGKVSTRAQLVSVSAVCLLLLFAAIITPKESRLGVPTFIYDANESVTSSLRGAGMPDEEIVKFRESPKSETLKESSYVDKTTVATLDKGDVEKYTLKNSEKQPYEIVNAVKAGQASVPLSALFLILCGLCTSVMWGGIFNLAVDGLGKYTAQASGFFMTMVVGGGVIPLVQQLIVPGAGYMPSYWLIFACMGYIFLYAIWGSIKRTGDVQVPLEALNEEPLV